MCNYIVPGPLTDLEFHFWGDGLQEIYFLFLVKETLKLLSNMGIGVRDYESSILLWCTSTPWVTVATFPSLIQSPWQIVCSIMFLCHSFNSFLSALVIQHIQWYIFDGIEYTLSRYTFDNSPETLKTNCKRTNKISIAKNLIWEAKYILGNVNIANQIK